MQHHRGAALVDAAPARPPGELRVLPRREQLVALPLPLREALDRHRAGRHVDAKRQRLGGEHHPDQPLGEQLLDRLLEQRQHAGVVAGDAPPQRLGQLLVAERVQVGRVERGDLEVDELADLGLLRRAGEPHPGGAALGQGLVAAGAGEDEVDRRQQPLALQQVDHVDAGRHPVARADPAPATGSLQRASPGAAAVPRPLAAAGQGGVRHRPTVAAPHQQRVQLVAHQVVVVQRDGAALLDHHLGRAPGGLEPLAELLGVGHGRRQRRHLDVRREVDQHLLPDRTAHPVLQVVDLVHDHVAQPCQGRAALVEHVAQHLGGHHHHRRLTVDRVVAGEQPDVAGVVARHEVAELLVGEGLQRRGVEGLAAGAQGQPDGELPHHRLAGPGRRGHQGRAAAGKGEAALPLEVVQLERVAGGELLDQGGRLGIAQHGIVSVVVDHAPRVSHIIQPGQVACRYRTTPSEQRHRPEKPARLPVLLAGLGEGGHGPLPVGAAPGDDLGRAVGQAAGLQR